MPMSRTQAVTTGGRGQIFAHLPVGRSQTGDVLAADGVSCALCHQIRNDKLGTRESFTGGFALEPATSSMPRPIFGPFEIDKGRTTIMRSATGFKPTEASHVRQSELCATCHTLYTTALGPSGEAIGELPEQVPYLEWRHSAFREERSCQSCHMPAVREKMPIASVLGEPREGLARHWFTGGNFFMLRMLNRYRAELGVEALPIELDSAANRTVAFLQSEAAQIEVESASISAARLEFDVSIKNLGGHKLPTAYPSRRVWLHVRVHDATGRTVFESGAVGPNGLIDGNDNDVDPLKYEPHYSEIRQPQDVQIYESIMAGADGRPTTGLLTAVQFIKDNRLLPRGFDKTSAEADIAVRGDAFRDRDFTGGGDRTQFSIEVGASSGPFEIQAQLYYQPISFRWAQNLQSYEAAETRRFVSYFNAMSAGSAEVLARTTVKFRR
jgi:cytochrome c551/c552